MRLVTLAGIVSLLSLALGPAALRAQEAGVEDWNLERHLVLARAIQEQIGVSADYTPPRTPWGHPDFEGAWTSDGIHGVPRTRPAEFGNRLFLTDEEYEERRARERQTYENALTASGPQTAGRDRAWRGDITFRLTSQVVNPANGQMPAVTPWAETRRASRDRGSFGEGPFDAVEDFTLYDRCITRGVVGSVLPVVYGNGNNILQTPDTFVIAYEMIHDSRIVPVDGRDHVPDDIRQYLGSSRGRFEGDTLVVETTNFTDRTSIGANGNGLRHSDEMRVVEHFTRIAADVILYDVTMIDPRTYATPWTVAIPLISPPGFRTLPYECHEGNNAVYNVLRGARAEDQALADDLARGVIRPRATVQADINSPPEE